MWVTKEPSQLGELDLDNQIFRKQKEQEFLFVPYTLEEAFFFASKIDFRLVLLTVLRRMIKDYSHSYLKYAPRALHHFLRSLKMGLIKGFSNLPKPNL